MTQGNFFINTKSEFLPSLPLFLFGENCKTLSREGEKGIAGLKSCLKVTNFYVLIGFPIQIISQGLRRHPV